MRLSDCIEIYARRLGLRRGRVAAIANRLQHAGYIPLADAKRNPPELSVYEKASLLLAVLAERGVGGAAERYGEYASMTSSTGHRLLEALVATFTDRAAPGDVIVKDGGASASINSTYLVFGTPAEDGTARFVTGATLAAIAAELQGAAPAQADAVAALTKIRNY